MAYQYQIKIRKWLAGEIDGNTHQPSVRRYLIETRGEQCEECGWARIHPLTGRVPLVVDHVDGDWTNTTYENLKLLCGGCNSLTPTFGALNSNKMREKFGLPPIVLTRRQAGVM